MNMTSIKIEFAQDYFKRFYKTGTIGMVFGRKLGINHQEINDWCDVFGRKIKQ